MKKTLFLALLVLQGSVLLAQEANTDEKEKTEEKQGWTGSGTFSLLFNQAAFNAEWQGGGTSNYAGNAALSYDLNYKKDRLTWDNKFIADYGMTKNKSEEFTRKTNDRLELNSVVGYKVKEDSKWSYSFFLNFKTQFAKGFEYEDKTIIDAATGEEYVIGEGDRHRYTHFMSPGYLQFGPGMLWKDSDNLKVNIAPATSRFIFVSDRYTTGTNVLTGEPYADGDYFGVDEGETMRFEFGASLGGYYKLDVVKNVTMENILNLYSNYLEDPKNVDIDYTMNLALKVNEFLSANFTLQAIYDDNAVSAFQIREMLGVGFNYKL